MNFATTFDYARTSDSTLEDWRRAGQYNARSARAEAKAWAKPYGEAKILRADGSVVRYWRETGPDGSLVIRQRTYRTVFHGSAA
jgi:hypothetical protein